MSDTLPAGTLQPGGLQTGTVKLSARQVLPDKLGFFRYGEVAGRVLLTNDAAEWTFLDRADFAAFLAGQLTGSHPKWAELVHRGFVRDNLDVEALATRIRRKKRFIAHGPHLHIVLTTLRCEQSCRYCHASRAPMDRPGVDMDEATAKQVVDLAFKSTSPYLNFEFQGGEPTVNFPIIQFIVEYAREKNRQEKKDLAFSLVSNLVSMTEERANWLVDHNVLLCTSLDGPRELHDFNRLWTGGGEKMTSGAFDKVMHWIRWFNARYVELGRDPELWHVDALMTTTRQSFDYTDQIIDLYQSLGIRKLTLRPLNPYGFANKTWKLIGYTIDEYLDFYARTLDRIIARNLAGEQVIEGTAAIFLAKVLTPDDPNFVDIRSPCGAGVGQVAYNYDGRIFTCDEARMTSAMGDDLFAIGHVATTDYARMLTHPTVRAMAVASLQDSLPGCDTCWNKPFCGVCPMHNYAVFGDIFGQRPRSPKCREYMTISRLLFERLAEDGRPADQGGTGGEIEKIFRRWTIDRPRDPGCTV